MTAQAPNLPDQLRQLVRTNDIDRLIKVLEGTDSYAAVLANAREQHVLREHLTSVVFERATFAQLEYMRERTGILSFTSGYYARLAKVASPNDVYGWLQSTLERCGFRPGEAEREAIFAFVAEARRRDEAYAGALLTGLVSYFGALEGAEFNLLRRAMARLV